MAIFVPILCIAAVCIAWQQGVRDWATLAVVAVVGPVAGLALLTAVWTAVEPIAPVLLPIAAVGLGFVITRSSNDDKAKKRPAQRQLEAAPEAPKTSKKRRIDAE